MTPGAERAGGDAQRLQRRIDLTLQRVDVDLLLELGEPLAQCLQLLRQRVGRNAVAPRQRQPRRQPGVDQAQALGV
ncbi:hypothetical protein GALL_303220 [mine drainage metagenome]|uniref:Uncharacterized protein n=1 Tax=mine drainage metagenome TaxID=410659 RepID=A0A1J5R6V8_9ZZZZ